MEMETSGARLGKVLGAHGIGLFLPSAAGAVAGGRRAVALRPPTGCGPWASMLLYRSVQCPLHQQPESGGLEEVDKLTADIT